MHEQGMHVRDKDCPRLKQSGASECLDAVTQRQTPNSVQQGPICLDTRMRHAETREPRDGDAWGGPPGGLGEHASRARESTPRRHASRARVESAHFEHTLRTLRPHMESRR